MREQTNKHFSLMALTIVLLAASGCGGSQKSVLKSRGKASASNQTSEVRNQNIQKPSLSQRLQARYTTFDLICRAVVTVGKKTNVAVARVNLLGLDQLPSDKVEGSAVKFKAKNADSASDIELVLDLNSVEMLDEVEGSYDVTAASINGSYNVAVATTNDGKFNIQGEVAGVVLDDGKAPRVLVSKKATSKVDGSITFDYTLSCGFEADEKI